MTTAYQRDCYASEKMFQKICYEVLKDKRKKSPPTAQEVKTLMNSGKKIRIRVKAIIWEAGAGMKVEY